MNPLQELFLDELADLLHAENQLVKALPKMAKAAQSRDLKTAFEEHLKETRGHVQRISQVFALFDRPAKAKKCQAMEGLVEEGASLLKEWEGSPALDAALISAAQKAEHYEIASYGTLCTWAELLGNNAALKLLQQTIAEEEAADKKLTVLAENHINIQAEEGESEEMPRRGTRPLSYGRQR